MTRVCACDGCEKTTDKGLYDWPCWSSRQDHGYCTIHGRAYPKPASLATAPMEMDEPSWGREVGR